MLSNTTQYQIYVDELYAAERKLTTVKIFVSYDTSAAAFNSLEFARNANKYDGEVCICIIQASSVVAGYLLGLSKMMDNIH